MKEAATELLGDRRAAANGMLEVSTLMQLDPPLFLIPVV
jgi:hypothetical protein